MDQTVRELLDDVRVASPCAANWDDMAGSDHVRSCERCQHKVYNLSEMTAPEAADLLNRAEGRLCVRFYRRSDGTMMTKDCPVGAQAAQRTRRRRFGMIGLSMASVAGLVGANIHEVREHSEVMGRRASVPTAEMGDTAPVATPMPLQSATPEPLATPATHDPYVAMGYVLVTPTRLAKPTPEPQAVMGAPMIAPRSSSSFNDKPYLQNIPAETTPPREDPFAKVERSDR